MVSAVFNDSEGNPLSEAKIKNLKEYIRVQLFHILEQLVDNPYWQKAKQEKGEGAYVIAASDKEFAAAERTFAKTLQEIFTRPTERLVFKRDDETSPDNTKDYSNIVIDPERITPTLLHNLGLDQFIPPKGVRMKRAERMKHMAQAIPHILEMMKHLEPLVLPHEWHEGPGKYFRLMRINEGPHRGYVMGTQTNDKVKKLFKTDIHGAYRRLSHIIEESYEEELGILTEIQMIAREIHSKLGNKKALSDSDMYGMFKDMQSCVDKLLHVDNEHKVKMREKIKRAITLGRNSGAQRAILVMIPKYAEDRKKDIRRISEHLHRDDSICRDFIREQQIPAEKIYADVEKKKELDARKPLADQRRERDVYLRDERNRIDPEESSMRQAPLMQPYLAFGEKLVENIEETRAINSGSLDTLGERTKLVEAFLKVFVVAKIQFFYVKLQEFYQKYLSPKKVPNFDDVMKNLDSLDELIGRKRVTAIKGDNKDDVITTPEYDDVYHKIYDLIDTLQEWAQGAKKLLEEDGDYADEIKQIKESMRNLVKDFHFDRLIYTMGKDCGIDFDSIAAGPPLSPQMDLPLRVKEPDQE